MNLNKYLLKSYGLSESEYDAINATQGGLCAICGGTNKPRRGEEPHRLYVDHNHTTEEVRGLLCDRCNKVLGMTEDSQDLLLKLLEYLRKHDGCPQPYRPYIWEVFSSGSEQVLFADTDPNLPQYQEPT